MDSRFDIVIIGSGLGSLECGLILSKEGYKVCILEQANILGGCLQSFSRKGSVIDTGIHYIGSMDEGKIMRQYFKYFGIYDDLSLQRLDDEFDIIYPGSDSTNSYSYMHGYENFKSYMISHFPGEKNGINIYCDKIKEIGDSINVSVHQSGKFTSGSMEYLSVSASEFIDQCVSDKTLRSVLAGTNVLYGGVKESSNLYHHAMINHSNIEGSYRFIGGTQKVADLFIGKIKENGGEVYNNAKVINIIADGDEVKYVQLADGRRVSGKGFISGIHPALTFNMLSHTPVIKKAYKTRLNYLPNTYGLFSVYMLMPPCEFNYINHNQYFFRNNNVWDSVISSSDKTRLYYFTTISVVIVFATSISIAIILIIVIKDKNKTMLIFVEISNEEINKVISYIKKITIRNIRYNAEDVIDSKGSHLDYWDILIAKYGSHLKEYNYSDNSKNDNENFKMSDFEKTTVEHYETERKITRRLLFNKIE